MAPGARPWARRVGPAGHGGEGDGAARSTGVPEGTPVRDGVVKGDGGGGRARGTIRAPVVDAGGESVRRPVGGHGPGGGRVRPAVAHGRGVPGRWVVRVGGGARAGVSGGAGPVSAGGGWRPGPRRSRGPGGAGERDGPCGTVRWGGALRRRKGGAAPPPEPVSRGAWVVLSRSSGVIDLPYDRTSCPYGRSKQLRRTSECAAKNPWAGA